MGFVSNLFGGGGGSGSGVGSGGTSYTNNAEIGGLQNIAGSQVQLSDTLQNLGNTVANQAGSIYNQGGPVYNQAGEVFGQGGSIYGQAGTIFDPAFGQYTGGIAGTLTPAQQALVTQNLGEANTATGDLYGSLGLGGSTMEGQDMAGNALKSLGEQANINFQNESLGLTGLQAADQYYGTGNQYYGTANQGYGTANQFNSTSNQGYGTAGGLYGDANSALSGATTALNDAGTGALNNQSALNSAISSLGNKSSSGLGGGLSNIIGGATGTSGTGGALASLFGGGGAAGNAALDVTGASGGFDLGSLAADAAPLLLA